MSTSTSNLIKRGLTCTGMISNMILINLIVLRSPKDLGLYKNLMIFIASFELFYGAVEFLTVPVLLSLDSAFFVIVDPEQTYLPKEWLLGVDLSLVIFGCQFAYRYHVLKGNDYWTACKPLNFFLWIGSSIFCGVFYSSFVLIFMRRTQYTDKVLIEVGYSEDQMNQIGFLGFMFYPKLDNGTEVINWDSFIGVSVTTSFLMASEFTMIYYAFKCFQATKSLFTQVGYSPNYRRLQWQLFYALVAQTIIPIFFMQIPMSLIYVSTIFFGKALPIMGYLESFTISLYLATDALPTIFIIKPYRETIFNIFCFWKNYKLVKVTPNQLNVTEASQTKYIHVTI